ncbi:MAG TPA: N-acylglucosamine 2-epimerase, partial [Bordetella sp.]|nr:N-acylglucosamine 2-epimerase [Bordetella sp.]
ARYLAAIGDEPALAAQLAALYSRFLHSGGWRECLDAGGALARADMPSTTPYHLATCYAALPAH